MKNMAITHGSLDKSGTTVSLYMITDILKYILCNLSVDIFKSTDSFEVYTPRFWETEFSSLNEVTNLGVIFIHSKPNATFLFLFTKSRTGT